MVRRKTGDGGQVFERQRLVEMPFDVRGDARHSLLVRLQRVGFHVSSVGCPHTLILTFFADSRAAAVFSKNGREDERSHRVCWPLKEMVVRFLKRYWGWILGGICLATAALAGLMWWMMTQPMYQPGDVRAGRNRSEEHTSELQSLRHLVCRL